MNEVYAVTRGSYSDYRVIGIFSTIEKANRVKEKVDDANDIEVYILDEIANELEMGYKLFNVYMTRSGNTLTVEEDTDISYIDTEIRINDKGNIYVDVWAKDEEHAIKIVNEKRAQLIAENKI